MNGNSKGSAASARSAALCEGTLKGKSKGSVVSTRPAVAVREMKEDKKVLNLRMNHPQSRVERGH